MQPRFIRLSKASGYLGMDKNRFNAEVRPYLTEIPIGVQGIAFDRLELDAFADYYVQVPGVLQKGGHHGKKASARSPQTRGILAH